ncbi:MAG TPA: M23 family metallopeptidase [Chthoniobacterales bacterium]
MFLLLTAACAHAVDLVLPTENDAIYRNGGPDFYMYVERNFEGVKSYPWQGGQYGFVRNPANTSDGVIFKRLHEGVDIKPVRRDPRGIPLDPVRTVSDGTVMYVNDRSGASNYGRYVVIRHVWDGCPYYSLYAHLNRADVKAGDSVRQGQTIGLLGFTGDGIDIIRAHLHFEINLFLTDNFDAWHSANFRGEPNPHGAYNGMNLSGIDVGNFLLKAHQDKTLTVPAFLAKEDVFYRVKVPAPGPAELARRYPWMAQGYRPGQAAEISFLRSGLPVKIVGLEQPVAAPVASWVRITSAPVGLYTKGYLQGYGAKLQLTREGIRFLQLLGVK